MKDVRSVIQLCAILDVAILGVTAGLMISWFDPARASDRLFGFVAIANFAGIFTIGSSLVASVRIGKRFQLGLSLFYVGVHFAIAAAQAAVVAFFATWTKACSIGPCKGFDPFSTTFVALTSTSIFCKLLSVSVYIYCMMEKNEYRLVEEDEPSAGSVDADSLAMLAVEKK